MWRPMFWQNTPMRKNSSSPSITLADPRWRIGIVHSSYYPEEVRGLIDGARAVFAEAGIPEENVTLHPAPGSFEIPLLGAALAKAAQVDALIGLGVIIEGETHHADLLAHEVARGIMDVQVRFCLPFAFEVLYAADLRQVRERSSGKNNRGREAAIAVLHSLAELKRIHT